MGDFGEDSGNGGDLVEASKTSDPTTEASLFAARGSTGEALVSQMQRVMLFGVYEVTGVGAKVV